MENFLTSLIAKRDLEHKISDIEHIMQTAIRLVPQSDKTNHLMIGQSRIGGKPDIPIYMKWPTIDGHSIPFLAQINLAEISVNNRGDLPKYGFLLFFSMLAWEQEGSDMLKGYTADIYNNYRLSSDITYHDVSPSQLIRTPVPPDTFEVSSISTIKFNEIYSLPNAVAWARDPVLTNFNWTEQEFDRLDYLSRDLVKHNGALLYNHLTSSSEHQLFGYPASIH